MQLARWNFHIAADVGGVGAIISCVRCGGAGLSHAQPPAQGCGVVSGRLAFHAGFQLEGDILIAAGGSRKRCHAYIPIVTNREQEFSVGRPLIVPSELSDKESDVENGLP